jgi:hypothetical protein
VQLQSQNALAGTQGRLEGGYDTPDPPRQQLVVCLVAVAVAATAAIAISLFIATAAAAAATAAATAATVAVISLFASVTVAAVTWLALQQMRHPGMAERRRQQLWGDAQLVLDTAVRAMPQQQRRHLQAACERRYVQTGLSRTGLGIPCCAAPEQELSDRAVLVRRREMQR